ncbi:unnamed protein product, partial [Iphiclides podalirius]
MAAVDGARTSLEPAAYSFSNLKTKAKARASVRRISPRLRSRGGDRRDSRDVTGAGNDARLIVTVTF